MRFRARPGIRSRTKTPQWTGSGTRFRSALTSLVGLLIAPPPVQGTWAHGDRSEGLAVLDAAVEANPDSVPSLLERAEAHGRLGHYDESLADLDRALAASPDRRVHYHRGLTLFEMIAPRETISDHLDKDISS